MTTLTRNRSRVLDGGPLNVAGAEAVFVHLLAPSDPTSGAAPTFALTQSTDLTGVSFTAGSWVAGSWDGHTKRAWAQTPSIGGAGDLAVEAGETYRLWCKPAGASGPVVDCGIVPVE